VIITLTTDFGLQDAYVGVMHGVILSIAPNARVVDLCHHVPPQDLVAGSLTLEAAIDVFPQGTIHVGVVDPGVGASRRAIALRTDHAVYVGPDNGLFTLPLQRDPPREAVELTNPDHHRPRVSATFHGRDIFSPVAAHLADGEPLANLGPPLALESLRQLDLPRPSPASDGALVLAVLHADRFGNLITNLTRAAFDRWRGDTPPAAVTVHLGDTRIPGVATTFSDVAEGEPVAYLGSSDRLEIAVRNGSLVHLVEASAYLGHFFLFKR